MAEELEVIIKEDIVEEVDPMSWLPKYMAQRKPVVKITKDLEKVKSHINTSLLPEKLPFEGEMFAKLPMLKLEDWDLANCVKFPLLAPSVCLE